MGRVKGRENEPFVSKWMGGKLTPHSGSGPWRKGDIELKSQVNWGFRMDLKCTSKTCYSFRPFAFDTLAKRCKISETPAFIICFCKDGIPRKERAYIILSEADSTWLKKGRTHQEIFTVRSQLILQEKELEKIGEKCPLYLRFHGLNKTYIVISFYRFSRELGLKKS